MDLSDFALGDVKTGEAANPSWAREYPKGTFRKARLHELERGRKGN
jgi:hypothetical protein